MSNFKRTTSFINTQNTLKIVFGDSLNYENIKDIESLLIDQIKINSPKKIEFNMQNVKNLDSSGTIFLIKNKKKFEIENIDFYMFGLDEKLYDFYLLCKKNFPQNDMQEPKHRVSFLDFFNNIGAFIFYSFGMLRKFFSFLGEMLIAIGKNFTNPKKLRFNAINFHIQRNGVGAIPIIAITAFLIGIVITYQGAAILQDFGANIYVVDFLGIGICRELAPLIVAIVIAGRSASAFTAEIGVMNITDEIDAMRTMGFSTWDFLVLPRVYALIISLPLLVFFANIMAILGGMIIANVQLGVSYGEFLDRFQHSIELRHIIVGLIKAPIFGFIIAFVGCFRGFEITGNTQNVGKYTTLSVVSAIFWVIAFDALASIFFTNIGI